MIDPNCVRQTLRRRQYRSTIEEISCRRRSTFDTNNTINTKTPHAHNFFNQIGSTVTLELLSKALTVVDSFYFCDFKVFAEHFIYKFLTIVLVQF